MQGVSYDFNRTKKLLLCCVCLSMIQACGFNLRGDTVLSARFPELQLNLQQPNSELSRELLLSLERSGIRVTEGAASTSQQALPELSVSTEFLSNRPVTVNPRARAAQYELQLAVTATLTANGETLLAEQTLVAERIYFETTATIAGSMEEVEIIQSEMRRDLVSQLLRRLEAL
jgi:LPS-assembly lipoprotein